MKQLAFIFNRYQSYLINFLVIVLSVTFIAVLQKPFLDKNQKLTNADYQRQENLTEATLFMLSKIPSFGFNNLIADWLYLDFIQYNGDLGRDFTGYRLSPQYFRLIVDQDPRFVNAYLLLDISTTLFAGNPDKSVEIMNDGLKYLNPTIPLAHQVWMYKGIDELLFLGEIEEAINSFRQVYEWGKEANTPEGLAAANRGLSMSQFLAKNPDSRLVRASAWLAIYGNTPDEKVKKLALDKVVELGGKVSFTGNTISVEMPPEK